MIRKDSSQFEKELNEIDDLIRQAIEQDFLTDKVYTEITTKIGTFDDAFVNSQINSEDSNLQTVINHLDAICDALMVVNSQARRSHRLSAEDFMHPTGDSFNEDNSISLSKQIKKKLKKLISEKI